MVEENVNLTTQLMHETLKEVKGLALEMAKVSTNMEHMQKELTNHKETITIVGELKTLTVEQKGKIDSILKDVTLILDSQAKWGERLGKAEDALIKLESLPERMNKMEKQDEERNVRIEANAHEITKLKSTERIIWIIMSAVITGLIGLVLTHVFVGG